MSTYSGNDDDGLEAAEVPPTPTSAFDPDQGYEVEADAPDADGGGDDGGPGNSDPGF